jgi:erythromycin esterase-like protein
MARLAPSEPAAESGAGQQLLTLSFPLQDVDDLDPLLERIGDARYVLLGVASHGTHEYYVWRARISRRLIEEKGFHFIAVEGDWPDCYRVNQYVHGEIENTTARDVLHDFSRWPSWMWANWEIVALAEWMRRHNDGRPEDEQIGFYGLDVYSLWESLYEIIGYLKKHHPDAVDAAYRAFRCFEPYDEDPQAYARASIFVPDVCRQDVLELLQTVRRRAADANEDAASLNAIMNAEAVNGAAAYYRAMVGGGAESWNLRDRHMADTLERLMRHYGSAAKAIVWEHDTHIGDARYTTMAREGMFNVGQLVRETHESDGVVLTGFGSYQGTVIAARSWDAPMEVMTVPPAMPGSWEHALHQMDAEDRLLLFHPSVDAGSALAVPRGNRAIGVVYHPEVEWGNYVPTVLPLRYDAFLYLDQTEALHPLHIAPQTGAPELYPWGV